MVKEGNVKDLIAYIDDVKMFSKTKIKMDLEKAKKQGAVEELESSKVIRM